MSFFRRIARRLAPVAEGPPREPARAVRPPTFQGTATGERFDHLDPERVQPLPIGELAALLESLPRPLLVLHQASWDEASTRALPAMVQTLAPLVQGGQISLLDLGWDRLREAPTGRIPGMAQRPARWWDGSELQAWHREHGVPWVSRLLTGSAEQLRDAVPADPFVLPALELWMPGEGRPRSVHLRELPDLLG